MQLVSIIEQLKRIRIIEQLKRSLLMLIQECILTLIKKIVRKVLNLKLVLMLEYQNIRIFLIKAMFEICLENFL